MAYLCADRYARYTALTPMATLSRVSGTAPCAVHCTAVGTTSSALTQPERRCWFKWEVVGASWGNWSFGSQEAKAATGWGGPNAGFLFTTAGTYTVRLSVFDGYVTKTADTVVTIANPDTVFSTTNTICINVNGDADFTGAPVGATEVSLPAGDVFQTAISTYLASGKRLLFKKGSTFNLTADNTINTAIVGAQIGAYGTGDRPIIASTTAIKHFILSNAGISDLTIYGLECNGSNAGSMFMQWTVNGITNLTNYDLDVSDIGIGAKSSGTAQLINPAFFECDFDDFTGTVGGACVYIYAQKLMVVGCNMGNNNVEHIIRTPLAKYAIISNNTLHDVEQPGVVIGGKHAIKMHAPVYSTDADISNWNVICANKFPVNDNCVIAVELRPETNSLDERVEDSFFERNWYIAGLLSQAGITVGGTRITVRNNIGVVTGAVAERLVTVERRGSAPAPTPIDTWVDGNTTYTASNDTVSYPVALGESNPCVDTICYNQLAWGPNNTQVGGNAPSTIRVFANATGTVGATGTLGNSSVVQFQGATSPFTDSTPADPLAGDFDPANYALGNGYDSGLLGDFNGNLRSFGNTAPVIDMGAVQA